MKRLASKMIGRGGRRGHRAPTALLAPALLLALACGAGCNSSDTPTYPVEPLPETMPWFFDVYGTDANNVYVAGNRGVMYRWDGSAWSQVDLNTDKAVTTIWGPNDGTLYLCGAGGLIMRNTGGGWSSMSSGTTEDLYGLGNFQGDIYACGDHGALRKLSGGSWQATGTTAVIRNAQANFAPSDTLDLRTDIASLLTVNYYCIGGAYHLKDWAPTDEGRLNTDGMVLALDNPPGDLPKFDWELRPRRGDQLALSEWVYCTTSDETNLANNYMATSEGWLFQLEEDPNIAGRLIWKQFDTKITIDRNTGIRDMWLAANGDLYMITDAGRIVYRSAAGEIREIYHGHGTLTGIWGTSPADFYVVGYVEELVLHCSYDPTTDTFSSVPYVLKFP